MGGGTALELMHMHATEVEFEGYWNGNTGKDASGELYAEEPAARGFGHIAFNVADVYGTCAELERNDVRFQKKPNEGRMKGLAFALNPDGYWIEICGRGRNLGWPEHCNLSQTMLRVKDGPQSVEFYTKQLGMTLLCRSDFRKWKFSLFFLASLTEEELQAARDRKRIKKKEAEERKRGKSAGGNRHLLHHHPPHLTRRIFPCRRSGIRFWSSHGIMAQREMITSVSMLVIRSL